MAIRVLVGAIPAIAFQKILTGSIMFDETKHPRDDVGKFTYSDGNGGWHIPTEAENKRFEEIGVTDKKRIVNIAIDTDIQRQFDKATPK